MPFQLKPIKQWRRVIQAAKSLCPGSSKTRVVCIQKANDDPEDMENTTINRSFHVSEDYSDDCYDETSYSYSEETSDEYDY